MKLLKKLSIEKNFKHLFSGWLEKSRFHRNLKNLHSVIDIIRIEVLKELGVNKEMVYIVDSMPIPVCNLGRAGFCKIFSGEASYGHCASKKETFYGFKLHVLTNLDGIPINFILKEANKHDSKVLPDLVSNVYGVCVLGDKGYVGEDLRKLVFEQNQVQLYALKRSNQKNKYPKPLNDFIKTKRRRIETSFSQLCDQFEIEKVYNRTIFGFLVRIGIKFLSFALCCLINKLRGVENIVKIKELIF